MAVLAQADTASLARLWHGWAEKPSWRWLRRPEIGLVMVRGRVGGTGGPFNLGEATVTRCALTLETGETGVAYCLGRRKEHVRLSALFDALWQMPAARDDVETRVVAPLAARQAAADGETAADTQATKVDFFTMVRGDND